MGLIETQDMPKHTINTENLEDKFFVDQIRGLTELQQGEGQHALLNFTEERLKELIQKSIQLSRTKHPLVSLSGYVDGKLVGEEPAVRTAMEASVQAKSLESALGSLPYSVKITGLQELDANVHAFCTSLSQALNWDFFLSANMYITPGPGKNCFEFHSDPHLSMIYQVGGAKTWLFPTQEQELVCHYNPELPLPFFDPHAVEEKHLAAGQWLFVPLGAIHRAVNEEHDVSVHVTFSVQTHFTYGGVCEILKKQLDAHFGTELNRFRVIDKTQLSNLLEDFRATLPGPLAAGSVDALVRARNMTAAKNGHYLSRRK